MDLSALLPKLDASSLTSNAFAVAVMFIAHRAVVSNLLKKTGDILTLAGDYIENSDPATLKEMFVDTQDVLSLVATLQVAAKYNGVSKAPTVVSSPPSINPKPREEQVTTKNFITNL